MLEVACGVQRKIIDQAALRYRHLTKRVQLNRPHGSLGGSTACELAPTGTPVACLGREIEFLT
jgi:hypothetical protein